MEYSKPATNIKNCSKLDDFETVLSVANRRVLVVFV